MSKYKVGDRVAVYERDNRFVGEVETVLDGDILGVTVKELVAALVCHSKQCRRLRPKPRTMKTSAARNAKGDTDAE